MRHNFQALILVLTVGAANIISNPAIAAEDYKRISTAADFNQLAVGKKLYLNQNYFVINKNGTLKGKFGGKTLKDAWEWRDGFWCRTLATHGKNTDCQLWTTDGPTHFVTKARGKVIVIHIPPDNTLPDQAGRDLGCAFQKVSKTVRSNMTEVDVICLEYLGCE